MHRIEANETPIRRGCLIIIVISELRCRDERSGRKMCNPPFSSSIICEQKLKTCYSGGRSFSLNSLSTKREKYGENFGINRVLPFLSPLRKAEHGHRTRWSGSDVH